MILSYFGLNIRLIFTGLFRIQFRIRIQIRIQNLYFGSRSDPDPAKSFGSFWIRICNTALNIFKRSAKEVLGSREISSCFERSRGFDRAVKVMHKVTKALRETKGGEVMILREFQRLWVSSRRLKT
jgi:hypothetical protein